MFLGTHAITVDGRGRFALPAAFRALLGAPTVHVWPSVTRPCLEGGGEERLARIKAELDAMGAFDERREALELLVFGEAQPLRIEETGRATLPADLRERAGITNEIAIVGRFDTFQLWSPGALAAEKARLRGVLAGGGAA